MGCYHRPINWCWDLGALRSGSGHHWQHHCAASQGSPGWQSSGSHIETCFFVDSGMVYGIGFFIMFYDRQLNRLTSISEGIAHVWFWSLHSVFSVMFESGLVCLFQLACLETQLQWGPASFFRLEWRVLITQNLCHSCGMFSIFGGTPRYSTSWDHLNLSGQDIT